MNITLNTDKHPFYSVGKVLLLTLDDPGPKEVDTTKLTTQEVHQLFYGVNSGALISDSEIPSPTYATPKQVPIQSVTIVEEVTLDHKLDVETKSLKKLLVGSIATVKKQLIEVKTIRQLKKLLSLERESSSRPGILKSIQSLLDMHQEQVAKAVGTEEISSNLELTKSKLIEGSRGLVNLANLTDVVESEETPISINHLEYKEE